MGGMRKILLTILLCIGCDNGPATLAPAPTDAAAPEKPRIEEPCPPICFFDYCKPQEPPPDACIGVADGEPCDKPGPYGGGHGECLGEACCVGYVVDGVCVSCDDGLACTWDAPLDNGPGCYHVFPGEGSPCGWRQVCTAEMACVYACEAM